MINLRGHMPRLVEKWMFSHLSPWKPHKCVLKPSQQGSFSLDDQFEGPDARFTLKMNIFPSYLLRNPINVCWYPHNRACFSKTIDLRSHMPRFTLKIEHFPIYLLWNLINVCWNPHNRAHLCKMIDLRGHMSRCTLKMNVFPSMSLETP